MLSIELIHNLHFYFVHAIYYSYVSPWCYFLIHKHNFNFYYQYHYLHLFMVIAWAKFIGLYCVETNHKYWLNDIPLFSCWCAFETACGITKALVHWALSFASSFVIWDLYESGCFNAREFIVVPCSSSGAFQNHQLWWFSSTIKLWDAHTKFDSFRWTFNYFFNLLFILHSLKTYMWWSFHDIATCGRVIFVCMRWCTIRKCTKWRQIW